MLAFTVRYYCSLFCHSVLPLSEVMGFKDKTEEMIRERLAEACRVSKDALSNP